MHVHDVGSRVSGDDVVVSMVEFAKEVIGVVAVEELKQVQLLQVRLCSCFRCGEGTCSWRRTVDAVRASAEENTLRSC